MSTHLYDAAHLFRALGSAALTADAVFEISLDKLTGGRGTQRNKLGAQSYRVEIEIEDFDVVNVTAAGPPATVAEEYTLTIETGAAGSPSVRQWALKVTKTGRLSIPIDAQTIENNDPTHAVIAVRLDVVGTAPSIKFAAWIV